MTAILAWLELHWEAWLPPLVLTALSFLLRVAKQYGGPAVVRVCRVLLRVMPDVIGAAKEAVAIPGAPPALVEAAKVTELIGPAVEQAVQAALAGAGVAALTAPARLAPVSGVAAAARPGCGCPVALPPGQQDLAVVPVLPAPAARPLEHAERSSGACEQQLADLCRHAQDLAGAQGRAIGERYPDAFAAMLVLANIAPPQPAAAPVVVVNIEPSTVPSVPAPAGRP